MKTGIIIRIVLLYIFSKLVYYYPGLKKYNHKTRFNFYRSLMCMYFFLNSSELMINNFYNGFSSPILYKNKLFNDITNWFVSYLIYDLLIIFINKNKRMDLIIHHIFCLFIYSFSKVFNQCNYIFVILLLAEVMSVVTGIDSIAKEDNNLKLSCKLKKFRIFIIRNIRIPIWIFSLLIVIRFNKHFKNKFLWYLCTFGPLVMIYLDNYWENKCRKFLRVNK
jgi:hypothetical protein